MEGSVLQAPATTATPTSLDPSAMLWEATFDAVEDEERSNTSISDEEKEQEDEDAAGAPRERCVSVTRGATLCVCVRDDAPALPGTVFISRFDAATPEGGKGPIEESGVVEVGDFLVKINDVDVVGKGARHALALLQKRAGRDSLVLLTFRRLKDAGRGEGAGEESKQDETVGGGLHLTEQRT